MKVVGCSVELTTQGGSWDPKDATVHWEKLPFLGGGGSKGGPLVLSLGRTQAPALTEVTLKSHSPGAVLQPLQAALSSYSSCSPRLYSPLPLPV